MGQETVVAVQLAVRRALSALLVQEPAPAPADKARQFRELAAFLEVTARELQVLASCELGIAAIEAGEPFEAHLADLPDRLTALAKADAARAGAPGVAPEWDPRFR